MSNVTESASPTAPGRRNFLTKSAVLLTALGVSAGAAGGASASPEEGRALNDVLAEGARTGNITAALQAHGQALSPQARAVLSKLTAADLRQIMALQTKLAGLRGSIAADNNGTIGM